MPSVPHPSLDTRAFLVTVSTKGDISPECVKDLVKHWSKTTAQAYAVTEHGDSGKLHLHAVVLYKESRSSRKIHENLWDRYVKKHHPDSIGKFAIKVQVCPGNKWYDEYLQKEADCTIVLDTYDREAAEEYFPTAAVQEALMATGDRKGVSAGCNQWWDKHVTAWMASAFTDTPEGALCYMKQCWRDGTSPIIKDPRHSTHVARALYEHRHKIVTCTERERFLLKQLEDGPAYDVPGNIQGERFASARPSI